MPNNDFYIGYLEKMPPAFRGPVRGFVMAAASLLITASFLIVKSQQAFSTSTFELGRLTTVGGVLRMEPAPMLQLATGTNQQGQPILQSILLIGFGKHGAEATLEKAEAQRQLQLDGKKVKLEGTLIYHDGKTLLELAQGEKSVLEVADAPPVNRQFADLGPAKLRGEIADPKCYFGVMKPGEGKVHRSCAARCIAGGIPPVLKATGREGQVQYFIIQGPDGRPANEQLLPVVGEPVQLSGTVLQYDDWLVLRLKEAEPVKRLGGRLMLEAPMCKPEQLGWME
ncbi:MAG: hypothetical protein J5I98_19835 [Phaeodactylibacter sp.]|nr:hypothetical protein [Phaeodactylibacter sp.]